MGFFNWVMRISRSFLGGKEWRLWTGLVHSRQMEKKCTKLGGMKEHVFVYYHFEIFIKNLLGCR